MTLQDIVIVDAVRTPVGKRAGGLKGVHPIDLLAPVYRSVLDRSDVEPSIVDQAIAGCVSQIGEQSFNVGRTSWLAAGLPVTVPTTTVDAQCGSSQQGLTLATGLVSGGLADAVVVGGVESMSRIPIGSNSAGKYGRPVNRSYRQHFEFVSQFEAAERVAQKWGVTRAAADAFGLQSQERAAQAWAEDRFSRDVIPINAPVLDDEGQPTGEMVRVVRDEGLRQTSLEILAGLRPVVGPDGVHTAGSSSQISDGASALLIATAERAAELGVRPRARIVDTTLVGVDPELMLTGPIDATRLLLKRTGLTTDDLNVIEINEAFASVVLAWQAEFEVDSDRINPNGGAIALGHPLGATGGILVQRAIAELERTEGRFALVTMCCGGGLGTGTIIERLG